MPSSAAQELRRDHGARVSVHVMDLSVSDNVVKLARENITHVLAVADAKVFNRSYQDQHGELWSPSGKLLATTTQIAYFKA